MANTKKGEKPPSVMTLFKPLSDEPPQPPNESKYKLDTPQGKSDYEAELGLYEEPKRPGMPRLTSALLSIRKWPNASMRCSCTSTLFGKPMVVASQAEGW